jgi:hypothetical protein
MTNRKYNQLIYLYHPESQRRELTFLTNDDLTFISGFIKTDSEVSLDQVSSSQISNCGLTLNFKNEDERIVFNSFLSSKFEHVIDLDSYCIDLILDKFKVIKNNNQVSIKFRVLNLRTGKLESFEQTPGEAALLQNYEIENINSSLFFFKNSVNIMKQFSSDEVYWGIVSKDYTNDLLRSLRTGQFRGLSKLIRSSKLSDNEFNFLKEAFSQGKLVTVSQINSKVVEPQVVNNCNQNLPLIIYNEEKLVIPPTSNIISNDPKKEDVNEEPGYLPDEIPIPLPSHVQDNVSPDEIVTSISSSYFSKFCCGFSTIFRASSSLCTDFFYEVLKYLGCTF